MASAKTFYSVTEKLRDILLDDVNVNTVTYGDITKVATHKTTIYPLSHFVVNSVQVQDNVFIINISLACMDIIDQTNISPKDHFNGNDNQMDIFNTQLAVISRAILLLRRAAASDAGFKIIGEPTMQQFNHRFEDDVAGWDVTFDLMVVQDMSIC